MRASQLSTILSQILKPVFVLKIANLHVNIYRSVEVLANQQKMGLSQIGVTPNLPINSNHGFLESLFSAAHELKSRYFCG